MKNTIFILCCFLAIFSNAQIGYQEHLIIGTGEYNPSSNSQALLQFDRADTMNSSPGNIQYSPSSTIPIRQCNSNGVDLNFASGFYLKESSNQLFVTTVFTNSNNVLTTNSDTAVGSIAIFDNFTNLNGAQTPSRHIFGDSTRLRQPHACWLDEQRDLLYVANTFGESVLVFEHASTINGNVAPVREIAISGRPMYVYLDQNANRIFVTVMPNGMPGVGPKVEIFNNVSILNGAIAPNLRISGSNTRLGIGNMAINNAYFRADKEILAIGQQSNELLLYDLSSVNWSSLPTQNYNLSPKVIYVVDTALGIHPNDINLYGFFWDTEFDRIYCSVGIDNPGGGPMPGSPASSIKVFENISDPLTVGVVTASREFMWNNSNTYYPPQAIWLKKTLITTTQLEKQQDWKVYPQPASDRLFIDFGTIAISSHQWRLVNILGQMMSSGTNRQSSFEIDVHSIPAGSYLLQIEDANGWKTKLVELTH